MNELKRELLRTVEDIEHEKERAAKDLGLGNFVALDGYVGVIGNGAGLTMSTLDVVAEAGGKPRARCLCDQISSIEPAAADPP